MGRDGIPSGNQVRANIHRSDNYSGTSHAGGEHFVHCSEVVPSLEVEIYGQYIGRGQTVCPL